MGVGRGRAILTALVLGLVALPVPAILTAAPAAAAAAPIKIMPLGDSITLGIHDQQGSSPGGYRTSLEDKLVAGGYSFDFVGTQPPSGPSSLADKNHEGHGGYTIQRVRDNIFTYLAKAPDVVLLMIGTNDMGSLQNLSSAPSRLESLITTILDNSGARVIVAKITPWKIVSRDPQGGKCDPGDQCISNFYQPQQNATANFNNAIPGIVARHSSRVSMVDMFTGFSRDKTPEWLADENHPNGTGYSQIANRWYPELKRVLDSLPTGATAPGPPRNVSATAGNGQATVSFDPPLSNGGSPITGYAVTATAGGGTRLTATSPFVFTGLTNGTAYRFTVKASNAVGQGAISNQSNSVTPTGTTTTAPGAPTIGTAVAGDKQTTVSFTPGANSAGATFTVKSSPGDKTKTGAASPLVVTELTNGTPYTFTVTASNSAGTSPPSSPSNSVTPTATPPPAGTTYLSDLPATQSGKAKYTRDVTLNGGRLKLNGVEYQRGLAMIPNTTLTLTFDLTGRGFTDFLSHVGVDDVCGKAGTVVFRVLLDGVEAYKSPVMIHSSTTQQVNLDVGDANSLVLEVHRPTAAAACDYGDWADARLTSG